MPHLSPMNWLFMLLFLMMMTYLINSTLWWKKQMKFQFTKELKSHTHKSKWNWL